MRGVVDKDPVVITGIGVVSALGNNIDEFWANIISGKNGASSIVIPEPEGRQAAHAMTLAVADGGINLEDIQYVNAHGTSTSVNDVVETKAIRLAFGNHADALMVSSTKSMIGHTLGAAGAIEAIVTLLSLHDNIVPPTINLENPDPACNLDYVPGSARRTPLRYAVSNSFGFGGQNISVLFGKV